MLLAQGLRRVASRSQVRMLAPFQMRSFSLPPHEKIAMPLLSPTMTHGDIIAWKLAEGDEFQPGDLLAEIQTDKASIDFEMQEEGFVAKILVAEGTEGVPVGTAVAISVEEEEDIAAFANYTGEEEAAPAPGAADAAPTTDASAPAAAEAATSTHAPATIAPTGERVFTSPAARKIAGDHGLDVNQIPGTGPKGRVIKADVLDFVAAGGTTAHEAAPSPAAPTPAPAAPAAPTSTAAYADVPVTSLRRVVAKKLTESKSTIPHYYVTVDVQMDELAKVRKMLNEQSETKISVNDFVMKASALAMRDVPEVNSSWQGDFIRQYDDVNINVAVAVDDGLVSPVVRNINKLGLSTISKEVRAVAGRARDGALNPDDVEIGTFTISNLGMLGVSDFCAIITPPQACVLAVGGSQTKFVPNEEDGSPVAINQMSVTLSSDHRVVDGAVAATWLNAFKGYLENPLTLLL